MLVALPVCSKDLDSAISNIEWAIDLDGALDTSVIISHEDGFDASAIISAAARLFTKVSVCTYPRWRGEQSWPYPQNWSFQNTARHIESNYSEPWFWWEQDAIPLCKDWLLKLEHAYTVGKRPFAGHVITERQYMNGVAIYSANISYYLRNAMLCRQSPWDVVAGKLDHILSKVTPLNNLIAHDPDTRHVDFRSVEQVEALLEAGFVLFHHCKDSTLLDCLKLIHAKGPKRKLTKGSQPVVRNPNVHNELQLTPVTIRRSGAIGDVIMALCVAKKLTPICREVTFSTVEPCANVIAGTVRTLDTKTHHGRLIDLDGAYEKHPHRLTKHKSHIFLETAFNQLGQPLPSDSFHNITPTLTITEPERSKAFEVLSEHPRPWIAVCPRSNSWPQRTVPRGTWQQVVAATLGTWFWTGTDPAPPGAIDLQCRDIRVLMSYLALADLVVSVDTGPMHIAAALGRPLLVMFQGSSPELHLTDQRDYQLVTPPLGCLNCQLVKCPINAAEPPCADIDPGAIITATSLRLGSIFDNDVSAVIPIYKPNVERLNRCLKHVLPQVSEVVIAIDGDGALPAGVTLNSKVKVVQNPTKRRRGFGKTCNHGARHSNGRWLLLLNDDVFLHPGAVHKMLRSANDKTAAVGCRLWYPGGTIQFGGCQRAPNDIGWGHIDHRAKEPTIKSRTVAESITFAVALIRRSAFYAIQGFDERYDCYFDDGDMCLSLRQAGWEIVYEPSAEGIHEESQSTQAMKNDLGKAAALVFKGKWQFYFTKNRDNTMGTF